MGALREMQREVRRMAKQLSLVIKNSQVTGAVSASDGLTVYSQITEPEAPEEFALWFQPATGGEPSKMYACVQKSTGVWAWRGPIWTG